MSFPTFQLERNQSLWENEVEINLTESGVEPMTLAELLTPDQREALLSTRLGYNHTEGTPALRRAIASWYPGASEAEVLATTGAAEANFLVAWTLLAEGGSLAVMLPNFMQLPGLAAAFGRQWRPFWLVRRAGRWSLDPEALAAAVGPDTRLIAVCNPNNPTGSVLTEAEMDLIVEAARRSGAWLLSDEIYRGAEADGRPETPTFWGRYERTIVTSSTSKALAHAGLRLGWMVAPAAFIAQAVERQDYVTIGTGPLNQQLAAWMLEPQGRARILARSRSILAHNLAIIDRWVASWKGRLSWSRPMAGAMAFVGYDFAVGSTELARRLREEKSVFVVPGDWFGLDHALRIGAGGHPEALEEGLARLDEVLRTVA